MKYRISQRADFDLEAIWRYIARDNPAAADRVEAELHSAMHMLAEHPGIGHTRKDVPNPKYRFWSVYSYLIVYRVEGRTLVIVRVAHGARDIRKLFRRQ